MLQKINSLIYYILKLQKFRGTIVLKIASIYWHYLIFKILRCFSFLAYSCVEKHKEAIECFKKAIVLEPENESYKSNLKLAEEKLASTGISPGPGAFAMPPPGALGGLDLGGLLGNPALMNMATTMVGIDFLCKPKERKF